MKLFARLAALLFLLFSGVASAEHVIVSGGPSLKKWEHLRVPDDQHDRWWANFIRAATLRMAEVRQAYGPDAPIVWMVHQKSYQARGREDGKPYTSWINEQAAKRRVTLIWVNSTGDLIRAINSRPRGAIQTFDYFGHSNRHAFMLDYGSEIMAASTAWLHERDLPKIKSSVFSKNAYCKSWGCHTGESMTKVWRNTVGIPLEGAKGKTLYTSVGQGKMPLVDGGWAR
ncbi:MAG: hypothetical protein EOP87_00620 [Verrucomicrobiaceae bacterium]|nr:MAG: hypothetical protein EOP87_00620 [Verrucomicrobiaceae bacterium]